MEYLIGYEVYDAPTANLVTEGEYSSNIIPRVNEQIFVRLPEEVAEDGLGLARVSNIYHGNGFLSVDVQLLLHINF